MRKKIMTIREYRTAFHENGTPYLIEKMSKDTDLIHTLSDPQNICTMMCMLWQANRLPEEHVWVIGVDAKAKPVGVFEISIGDTTKSAISIPSIFRNLLLTNVYAFFLVHNHPSGDIDPSEDDIKLTKRIEKAGKTLGLQLLDHVIIGTDQYLSMKLDKAEE